MGDLPVRTTGEDFGVQPGAERTAEDRHDPAVAGARLAIIHDRANLDDGAKDARESGGRRLDHHTIQRYIC
ncbi:hypothetical protein GCM10009808_19580 [Microbacterium sediminicola]|uniref:Uncharacterized protein n=1 Tax=Microbacterium sediminicola TaxID=415210 RepID=A0ABN2IBB5_9MICO